jgi:hypothetical protein
VGDGGRAQRGQHGRAVGGVHRFHQRRFDPAVDAEAVLGPADRAREHLVGIGHAGGIVTVVVIGRIPRRAVERQFSPVRGQQVGRGHDRVEVVVDGRVRGGHVVVGRRAPAVDVGVADEVPRGKRAVGHVELHRPAAAAGEVQPVVDARRRGEGRLLPVDRGDQQPVDPERALGDRVDRVEAFHPAVGDVRLGLIDEAHGVHALLGARRRGHDRVRVAGSERAGPTRWGPFGEDARGGGRSRGGGRRRGEHGGRRGVRHRAALADEAGEHRHEHGQAERPDRAREHPRPAFGGRHRDVGLEGGGFGWEQVGHVPLHGIGGGCHQRQLGKHSFGHDGRDIVTDFGF